MLAKVRARRVCLRDPVAVAKDLGVFGKDLPPHIAKFGAFMARQAQKEVTPRDVVKAALITRASQGAQAATVANIARNWPDHPFTVGERVRPEDMFAELLLTADGQVFLDDVTRTGKVTQRVLYSWSVMFLPFRPTFGDRTDLANDGPYMAAALVRVTDEVRRVLRNGSSAEWQQATAVFREARAFIGDGKLGFFAAFLGRGDLATFDARQIELHVAPGRRRSFAVTAGLTRRLSRGLRRMEVRMPDELLPFYEHLTHHMIWEKVGDETITHEALCRVMELGDVEPLTHTDRAMVLA